MTSDSNSRHQDHAGEWGAWFRASCDKWLCTWIIGMFMVYNLHVMHDKPDNSQIQIVNGWINNVIGALLVLVTQGVAAAMAKAKATTKEDPITGVTTGTLELKKDGE